MCILISVLVQYTFVWLNRAFSDKPENTQLTSNASRNVALVGDYVLFTCIVGAAKPAASQYRFFRGNTSLSSPTEGKYLVEHIQYPNQGVYKCIPNNMVGEGQEATLILTVQGKHCLLNISVYYCQVFSLYV